MYGILSALSQNAFLFYNLHIKLPFWALQTLKYNNRIFAIGSIVEISKCFGHALQSTLYTS